MMNITRAETEILHNKARKEDQVEKTKCPGSSERRLPLENKQSIVDNSEVGVAKSLSV